MNTLLDIIRNLAVPIYGMLLLLAASSGWVRGYKEAMRGSGFGEQATNKRAVAAFFLRLREYLANQDDAFVDVEGLGRLA